jgi:hypothetical protein
MISIAAITAAMKSHMADLQFSPAIPVAWPNRDFDPSNAARFLVVQFVRADNERVAISTKHRYYGSMVVTVFSRTDRGSGEADGLADGVAAHFPADLRIPFNDGTIRISDAPSIKDGFLENGRWRTPVVVKYEVLG